VSLETALQSLQTRLTTLQKVLSDVSLFLNEPVPLVDDIDNTITELISAAEEAEASLNDAISASQPDGSLDTVFAALRRVHGALNRCTAAYIGLFVPEIPKDDSLHEKLIEGGWMYGDQWLNWSGVVRGSIRLCATPLNASAEALAECWHEMAVRLARHSVSVQATNIGQQITVRDDQLDLVAKVT
jgi:hypothetical protein